MPTSCSVTGVTQNLLTFRVTLIFLALVGTSWALKVVQRSQKLSRSIRPSLTSSKTLASVCYAHFPQRYRGGNAKFADMPCYLDLFSLDGNNLDPEGGAAIAEALKINKTITNIK